MGLSSTLVRDYGVYSLTEVEIIKVGFDGTLREVRKMVENERAHIDECFDTQGEGRSI